MYAASPRSVTHWTSDVKIDTGKETDPKELRAARQLLKENEHTPSALGVEHLGRELVVVLGPDMSPADAEQALQVIIDSIRRGGLFNGRDRDGEYTFEPFKSRGSVDL